MKLAGVVKVRDVGSSYIITIPKNVAHLMGLNHGDILALHFDPEHPQECLLRVTGMNVPKGPGPT